MAVSKTFFSAVVEFDGVKISDAQARRFEEVALATEHVTEFVNHEHLTVTIAPCLEKEGPALRAIKRIRRRLEKAYTKITRSTTKKA